MMMGLVRSARTWLNDETHTKKKWTILPYILIAALFLIVYNQDKAEDARNQKEQRLAIADAQYDNAYNTFLRETNEADACRTAADNRENNRGNWIDLYNVIDAEFDAQEITAQLRANLDERSPVLDKEQCPPYPVEPKRSDFDGTLAQGGLVIITSVPGD